VSAYSYKTIRILAAGGEAVRSGRRVALSQILMKLFYITDRCNFLTCYVKHQLVRKKTEIILLIWKSRKNDGVITNFCN
jgi:hypothetical protein